jgi:4-amino-4-deoxy-L-arabinose transferase-like glycosyltransferase
MQKLAELFYPLLILFVFGLLFFFSLGTPVVIDYDEGVYAEVSKEMYEAGELIVPTLNGRDFFEKPPMLYWLQMGGYQLFGTTFLGARFFNALAGLTTLLLFYFGTRSALGGRTAFNATLILGSSVIFVYLARVAMTDMVLTMFLTGCLITSWHGVERELRDQNGRLLFWLGCLLAGLAMLSKGAIGALFPLLTAVIYLVSIGRAGLLLRPGWFGAGSLIILFSGFSWYILLGATHPEGFSFMKELFLEHHVGRFSGAMEGHSGGFYYYLIVLLVGFMPWFSYLPLAFAHMKINARQEPGVRYVRLFVISALLVFLFFSIAATKLPNYILPALPGFALLLANLFNRKEIRYPLIWRLSGYLSAGLALLLGVTVALIPFIFPYLHDLLGEDARKAPVLGEIVSFDLTLWLGALLLIISAIIIGRASVQTQIARIFEALVIAALLSSTSLFFLVLPHYDRLFDAPLASLSRQAASLTPPDGALVLYEIDDRPSVNFVSGLSTIDHSEREYMQLVQQFDRDGVSVGITTVYYFERLRDRGIDVIEILRDGGFVLFRPPPPPQPAL